MPSLSRQRQRTDKAGRITIPVEMLERLDLEAGDVFTLSIKDGRIILTPLTRRCLICHRLLMTASKPMHILGRFMCKNCVAGISKYL